MNEYYIEDHIAFQKELMIKLARYKALTPETFGFMNFTLKEIVANIKIIEKDPQILWDTLKEIFGVAYFQK